jgi:hypothetical protein
LMPYFQVPLLHLASLPDALSLHCDVSLQRSTVVNTPFFVNFSWSHLCLSLKTFLKCFWHLCTITVVWVKLLTSKLLNIQAMRIACFVRGKKDFLSPGMMLSFGWTGNR